jgi:hypothetical protein
MLSLRPRKSGIAMNLGPSVRHGELRATGLRRLAVERFQRCKEDSFLAAGGVGLEFLGEACRAEEA